MTFRYAFSLVALAALLAEGWQLEGGWAGDGWTSWLVRRDAE
jgi:hypothetical protein